MADGDYSPLVWGHRSGRMQPQQWQAPDGSWALAIGAELPGADEDIVVGDHYGLKQEVDFTGVYLLGFAVKFRQSASAATTSFQAKLLIDDIEYWSLEPAASQTAEYARRTINVTDISGSAIVEFRLEAVTP